MNKQQCCLVQRVRMHGNLGATQLLRNTRWSRTTNEDSTALRGTHASLNVTHGGKKKPCNTAWRTAYAVTLCVAHLRCRRDKHRRIEYATRHPVLPRRSMHSLDVTHTNITFTRSSQTTDLSTNVNTTNTDSFTHKTTNKTNKNPIRHFHTKHDKLKPSHERTTSRARLSGSKMEPTHRANNKSWRELVNKRRHVQYMKRNLEDQLIAPNEEHELDCFRSFMKLYHDPNETPTRKTNRNTKRVFGVQENGNTQIWNIRLAPSPNPHKNLTCAKKRVGEKQKTHPTRAMPSGIQLIQGCHLVTPKTSTQTQLSRTPRMLRKKPQKVSGDVIHQKHQLLTCTSTDIPGFTHQTHKHLRHMRETNNLKQTQGTTCDDTQCTVKSRQEKLLSVNSDLETKLRILYFARLVPKSWSYWVHCGTPRWFAWQNMVQELTSGYSSPMPMWQDRSTSAKHTDALPWTQTPNRDNFIQKLLWNSLAIFNVRQIRSKETFLSEQPTTDSISQPTTTNARSNRLHNTQTLQDKHEDMTQRNFAVHFYARTWIQLPDFRSNQRR